MTTQVSRSCEELRRMYVDEGMGVAAIAAQLGCSPPTVSNRLRRCGIPTRAGRFVALDVPREQLERLYGEERLPLRVIADRLGVSVGTINNRITAFGIPRRGRRSSSRG